MAATAGTRLGQAVSPLLAAHPALSGIAILQEGRDAFAARAMLAAAAERSLDVQYYIWRADTTGTLLLDALRAAAARGVRVRLLLDDNNNGALDATLAALATEPGIEVRLFNPFAWRGSRMLGFVGDFERLNRRMHNKSFTADNQATVIGGRNVGDEYFGAAGDMLFADLDVLAIGPVVDAVSRDFDRYWNSRSAYPVGSLVAPGPVPAPPAPTVAQGEAARAYLQAMRDSPFVAQLVARTLPLAWARTRLLSDDPDKVLGPVPEQSTVAWQLTQAMGEPKRHIDLVSPYFVPGEKWSSRFAAMARSGVEVFILTNSLEATDVAAVHAGYARWRVPMLDAGVHLYELRRAGEKPVARPGPGGSSSSSLHAKTFVVDSERLFIGSFNFDPRSADLNTEMGFVIDSADLAARVAKALRERAPAAAYRVGLDGQGQLTWTEAGAGAREGAGAGPGAAPAPGPGPGAPVVHSTEPGTRFWQRAAVKLLSLLPLDWML